MSISNHVLQGGIANGGLVRVAGAALPHAGYAGSNNMGVEVDWRDITKLVSPSATVGRFTSALMKFMSDLGKEHFDSCPRRTVDSHRPRS